MKQRLHLAFKAFISILLQKQHIYCDAGCYSAVGSTDNIWENIDRIAFATNEEIDKENLLFDAIEILENHPSKALD